MYESVAITCFRYFNFTNFDEIDKLTIPQYEILIKTLNKKIVDKEFYQHRQAFLNFLVQSKRKAGKNKTKPVFSTFKKFYDYEKRLKEVDNKGKKSKLFQAITSHMKGSE